MVDSELVKLLSDWKEELKGNMDAMRDELKSDMNAMRDELKSDMDAMRDELKSDMNAMHDELKSDMNAIYSELKKDINSINQRLQSVENICTVIQKEHGEKLDLLLDYASANIEKHEEYDKKIEHFENKFFDHDVRLGIIEGSDWYKKMIKGKGNSNLSRHALS